MTPMSSVIVEFIKGAPPPERLESEPVDDFQARTITWLKGELKAQRALVWAVLAMECLNYLGVKLPGM